MKYFPSRSTDEQFPLIHAFSYMHIVKRNKQIDNEITLSNLKNQVAFTKLL